MSAGVEAKHYGKHTALRSSCFFPSQTECERRKKAEPSGSRLVSLTLHLERTRTFMRTFQSLPLPSHTSLRDALQ